MVQYILLFVTFQVLFLVIYDVFLKGETFFQWNRVYLISTFLVSLVMPFVKLAAFATVVPEQFSVIVLDEIVLIASGTAETASLPWMQLLFFAGMVLTFVLFVFKIIQLVQLRRQGKAQRFSGFIKVIVPKSSIAFSFYNTVFLGDAVSKEDEKGILEHELIHIKQKHTLDLLFFEVMRILFWFNPLVYVYQSRISELHEFIADSYVGKGDKKAQYNLLLSQIFQTKDISFINHFFKSSLIKKRIVMLQKSKSNKILKFKYLVLVPLIASMLFYTSCEIEEILEKDEIIETVLEDTKVIKLLLDNEGKIKEADKVLLMEGMAGLFDKKIGKTIFELTELDGGINTITIDEGSVSVKRDGKEQKFDFSKSKRDIREGVDIPFNVVDIVPVFPGCENAEDKRKCFNEQIQKHIRKNFRYPVAAQEQGIQGKVYVQFIIQEDGTIGNVRMRGPSKILEEEAARIVGRLPRMTPGAQRGKAVRVPFSLPITFRLR